MSTNEAQPAKRRPQLRVGYLGRIDYGAALQAQEALLSAKIGGDPDDDLLLLEHPAVYTLGRGADASELRDAPGRLGVPVYRVGRGGGATFHGPGQLVSYPVVRLRPSGRDVHRYIRSLERVLLGTCAALGLHAEAREGRTGAWVDDRKVGSIGIGVRRGIAFHGTSLNVDVDPAFFSAIVVCRAPQARITSIHAELGSSPGVEAVASVYAEVFAAVMGYPADRLARAGGTPCGGAADAMAGAL
jgi:lipoyl(octanoyl) transferase